MNVIRYPYGFYFTINVTTNGVQDLPYGNYYFTSPGWPALGDSAHYVFDATGFNQVDGGPYGYPDYATMASQLTNGLWTAYVTNSVATNIYHFTVKLNTSTNDFPLVNITYPANGAVNVPNQVTFTWTGPTDYTNLVVYETAESTLLPYTQTTWQGPVMPDGVNNITVHYDSNSTTSVVSSQPVDSGAHPISSWSSTDHLQDYNSSQFTVGMVDPSGTAHTLVGHYPFDATNGPVLSAAQDTSGNGYDISFGSGYGAEGGINLTNDSWAGIGALQYNDGDGSSGGALSWSDPTPPALLSALAGSFTVSCWIKTSQNFDFSGDNAVNGAGIVSANVGYYVNDTIPIALTGGNIAFCTGGNEDDTMTSQASVNDGNYHLVTVTRNQLTGQKIIYIDGVLDSFASGSTATLDAPQTLFVGSQGNCSEADPNDDSPFNGYNGELDDLQIYSGALSSNDVANLYNNPGTTIPNGGSSGGHTGVAHLTFDNFDDLGQDSSGHGNDLDGESYWGEQQTSNTDAYVGGGAVQFFGTSAMTPDDNVQGTLDSVLAGSFTFSIWVNTTNSVGNDYDNAYFGATIFWAFNDHSGTNDTIPLSITGHKAAFTTRDHLGNFTTIHSQTTVNDGNYHLITVTRNQADGEMKIYVDGNFEDSDTGSTDPLNGNNYFLSLGGTTESSYSGLLDDFQIYAGVLSESEVARLYANPGTMIPDVSGSSGDFNSALGTTGLSWTTSGDSNWFIEETNTDGVSSTAAQSGQVQDYQSSTLSVTVTGPGTLSFYWSSQDPNGGGFDYEFDIDGQYQDEIYFDTPWYQELDPNSGYSQPFSIPAGQHTLTWTTYAYGDEDPTEAGFLADVSYVTTVAPIISLNPFNQTNYPGYQVWLNAGATPTNSTWQWYEVGYGAIPGATSSYYIPTNSGTASVAGSYYAIVTDASGSINTTTALVSFVTAPLPPPWTTAFKSPFEAQDPNVITKDYYYGCCTDPSGNVYAAAEFGGNMTVGTVNWESGPGGDAAAIVKQSPTGVPLWAVGITNTGNGSSYGLCVAPATNGGVYLAGNYNGTNWLGTNQLSGNIYGNGNVFVADFDANGSNLWVRTFGATNNCFMDINSLAADPAGNVTLVAFVGNGPLTVGSSNYVVNGSGGLLLQLNPAGAIRWSQLLTNGSPSITYGNGRLYVGIGVTGGTTTNVSIGGITYATDRNWAMASLNDTNGQALWVRGIGAPYGSQNGNPYETGLVDDIPMLAASGTNVFVTGIAYSSNATFGAITVNFNDDRGQYLARYDTNGNVMVATNYGSLTTSPKGIVANAQGNVYISGVFDTYSFFGNDMIAAPEENRFVNGNFSQSFLAKFDPKGNALWANEGVSMTTAVFLGIALGTNGVWASGWCESGFYPQTIPVLYGTNQVYSDKLFVSGGAGRATAVIWYPGGVLANVSEVTTATPVTLLNTTNTGANFQFQFLSESGFNHDVLYRTNLIVGNWKTNSTISGDGTLKTISLPFTLFSPAKQGFVRVTTR
ncbi:MAG TPA: LamG-like jellyroll fold domain-containing protein [Verrucomicrobiae bacterium]